VDPRPNPKKTQNQIPPIPILFTIQRENQKFPQKQELHLATLFPVDLRDHPFSEFSPKNPILTQIFPIPFKTPNPAYLMVLN
jgi:hypothetical protein